MVRTLLFDIDGTLIATNEGGKNAMARTLEEEFGVAGADVDLSFAGRTDRGLVAELFGRNDLADTADNHERFRVAYSSRLPSELTLRGGIVFPGIEDLLPRLAARSDVRVAAMTGNYAETAMHKLQHFDLHPHIQWVVGGDHDADRNQMAQRALGDLITRHGEDAGLDVVVIGDTPADVRCGHAIGASVVAVCTGSHTRDELQQECPAVILDDFCDVDAAEQLLTAPQLFTP